MNAGRFFLQSHFLKPTGNSQSDLPKSNIGAQNRMRSGNFEGTL